MDFESHCMFNLDLSSNIYVFIALVLYNRMKVYGISVIGILSAVYIVACLDHLWLLSLLCG